MRRVAATAPSESELPKVRLYGCRATPQQVGDFLRRKAIDDVFFVEKTLVQILGKC